MYICLVWVCVRAACLENFYLKIDLLIVIEHTDTHAHTHTKLKLALAQGANRFKLSHGCIAIFVHKQDASYHTHKLTHTHTGLAQ